MTPLSMEFILLHLGGKDLTKICLTCISNIRQSMLQYATTHTHTHTHTHTKSGKAKSCDVKPVNSYFPDLDI
jgi:hypothetical protein